MKMILIGATGFVGAAILKEALDRNHSVTAVLRHPENLTLEHSLLFKVQGDVMDTDRLAELVKGHEAVISAYNAGWGNPTLYADYMKGAQSIQQAVKKGGVKRLIVMGGAGSLFVAPGLQLIDTPDFPVDWKSGAVAARDYLEVLKMEAGLDWTYFSPAIEMNPGTSGLRKGTYREGKDHPVFDESHRSILSVEDVAVAVIDEMEIPKHIGQRFTAAY